MNALSSLPRKAVRLPCSSTRAARHFAHLKLIERMRPIDSPIAFEGRLLKPGAVIDVAELPERAVILECAGLVGAGRRRPCLWILWSFDWRAGAWIELGRAASVQREWVAILHGPALRALSADRGLVDVSRLCNSRCDDIMRLIDARLEMEPGEIKVSVLGAVYQQVAGRIAEAL